MAFILAAAHALLGGDSDASKTFFEVCIHAFEAGFGAMLGLLGGKGF